MLRPFFFIAVGGGVKSFVFCGRGKRLSWQARKVDFLILLCYILSVKNQECPLWGLWWGVNVEHLVPAGDGSTSSAQRQPSHSRVEYTCRKDRDDKWIGKCCQVSHAVRRGWTCTFFPWQAALKAAHAASQICMGQLYQPTLPKFWLYYL